MTDMQEIHILLDQGARRKSSSALCSPYLYTISHIHAQATLHDVSSSSEKKFNIARNH